MAWYNPTRPLLIAAFALGIGSAHAQDSKALIDVLVRKGILTNDEAAAVIAEAKKEAPPPAVATSAGKYLNKLVISGRLQVQYAGLATDIDGTEADPASTNHFFLRRVYLGAKADLGAGWSGNLNYDFAGSTFDAAFIQWRYNDALVVDVGFRKAPIGLEEWYTSSGNLRAIERSPASRFFMEANTNGRRLGAGSYRTGVFVGGRERHGLFYNVAVTNPERDESAAGVTSAGIAANNNVAYWANGGYAGHVRGSSLVLSVSGGYLPDQGGKTLGTGDDLLVYNAFLEASRGPWDLQLEYFGSKNEHGVSATRDAQSAAWSIQPAYRIGLVEAVLRYSRVDSDGRGLTTADLIRSAPSGGTMDKLSEWYAGLNLYLRGNDAKWQVGYLRGESKDTVNGGAAKATTDGVRSQLQLNF